MFVIILSFLLTQSTRKFFQLYVLFYDINCSKCFLIIENTQNSLYNNNFYVTCILKYFCDQCTIQTCRTEIRSSVKLPIISFFIFLKYIEYNISLNSLGSFVYIWYRKQHKRLPTVECDLRADRILVFSLRTTGCCRVSVPSGYRVSPNTYVTPVKIKSFIPRGENKNKPNYIQKVGGLSRTVHNGAWMIHTIQRSDVLKCPFLQIGASY